ncbi:MAG: arsenite methyltransferase [Salinivirgaceae bacterium]
MNNIKKVVQEKYTNIVLDSSNCCGGGTNCCGPESYTVFSENYENLKGYNKDADYNLGCGIPTEYAQIKLGNSVLDLGSGAGNDCFVARAIVGETGKVTGLDFTDAMIQKANANRDKLRYTNVEFVIGDIESMPLPDNSFDVIISNCVLNLVPDKQKAFAEMYRVLKPGAHFCVSDVIITGNLPENIQKDAEMYAGCVSGAIKKEEYLEIIEKAGFVNIQVKKEKEIRLSDELLLSYLTNDQILEFRKSKTGIYSITVYANKI